MVCVAAIALGSSTYAWFVSNNKVDATVSSISAQSNAAYLTINTTESKANEGTLAEVNLTSSPVALYPSRPKEENNKLSWETTAAPASLTWQTAYAASVSSADAQTDADGNKIYYDLTHTTNLVTGTTGYVSTSQVYVSSSQGAFNSLKVDSMNVTGTATGENAKNEIVNAVGALISCGNEWELWEYDSTTSAWKQTTKSTNSLSGTAGTNFGNAATTTTLTVDITLFYDGDYETIKTDNINNLGQAKVALSFNATPVQQGVDTDYNQNYNPNPTTGA